MTKRTKEKPLEVFAGDEIMEMHVSGELLPNRVYQEILDRIKENMESGAPKKIRFVVFTFAMLKMIRYSIPSDYYYALEVRNRKAPAGEGVMLNAVGM